MHILHIGPWPKHSTDENNTLRQALTAQGITITSAPDIASISPIAADLILVGANEKSKNYLSSLHNVLKDIQNTTLNNTPILTLSAQPTAQEIALALNTGADDVITLTQPPIEVLARLHALLRRKSKGLSHNIVRTGKLSINFTDQSANIGTTPLRLTSTEFNLLAVLARNLDKTIHNQFLRDSITPPLSNNALKVHMSKIRTKLKNADPQTPYMESRQNYGRRLIAHPFPKG